MFRIFKEDYRVSGGVFVQVAVTRFGRFAVEVRFLREQDYNSGK
jgi:hypothetical protein